MAAVASYATVAMIRRPIGEVFAYLSDLRSELEWNPRARCIEKLTDGPVGIGTRYRAEWRGAPSTVVEMTRFEPPQRWHTSSRSLGMDVVFVGEVAGEAATTRYTARLHMRAGGLARLLLPFTVRAMRRQDEKNMALIKAALEKGAAGPARSAR